MNCRLSVIIPAYNEERRLPRTLRRVIGFLKRQQYPSEIFVVSDGSSDGTKDVAESYAKEFPSLRIIEYAANRGKGHAVKTGILKARGEYRLFMDADYAVPIEHLPAFLSAAENGDEIVMGSRALGDSTIVKHQKFFREKFAKLFGIFQRMALGLPFKDTQCGFKLFRGDTAERLFRLMTLDCAYFDTELLYVARRLGMRIRELPVRWTHDGETRLPIGPGRSLDLLVKVFKIRKIHGG